MDLNASALAAALPNDLQHCVPALVIGLVPAEFLAAALGLGTVKSVHARLTRNPASLPPVTRIPGNRRIFFRLEDVDRWISSGNFDKSQLCEVDADVEAPRRGRGRPRKIGGTAK